MSWRNPRTTNEAPFIKSSKFEKEVRDNLKYLKTTVAAIQTSLTACTVRDGSTVAYVSPPGTRVKSTVYQNTSGKIRMVTVSITGAAANDGGSCYVGAANPPTIEVADIYVEGTLSSCNATFLVPPSYYYKVTELNATMTINDWIEWDIL